MPNLEFEAMHKEMRAYVLNVERYATRVLHCLAVLASSEVPHPVMLQRLAEDTKLLAVAKAVAG